MARELLSRQRELADVRKSYEGALACECGGTGPEWLFSPSAASGGQVPGCRGTQAQGQANEASCWHDATDGFMPVAQTVA